LGPTVPFWALHLAEEAVVAVRVRCPSPDRLDVLEWWRVPVPPGSDPAAVAVASLRRRGHRGHAYQVVLPGRGAICRSCRISPEDADLSPAELERELVDFTPFEADEAILRTRRLGGPGVLDYRVVAERRGEIGRVEKLFEDAGRPLVGISSAPAALLATREALRIGPDRGFALEIHGTWSMLVAFEGLVSSRYPIPFGLEDVRRRLAEEPGAPALDAALDAPPGGPGAAALARAAEPLLVDLRRAMEFHRVAVHPTGDERLLLLGEAGARPGLRACIAAASPVPAAPPALPEGDGRVRAGPGVDPAALAEALPRLFVPLGAAASAALLSPRDLDFRHLPPELPAPSEGSLFPAAAAVLAAGVAAAWLVAADARDALVSARAALRAAPPPAPPGALAPDEALALADDLDRAAETARSRAALGRLLSQVVAAFPRAGDAPAPALGAERIEVRSEGGNYRARVVLRVGAAAGDAGAEAERLAIVAEPLAAAGWRLVESRAGTLTVERLELRREGAGR